MGKLPVLYLCAVTLLPAADLNQSIVFRATFDGSLDAKTAKADKRLYSAADYKEQGSAKPGLEAAAGFVEHARGEGRNGGDALRFLKQNTRAVFYKAKGNIPFDAKDWSGTISVWLKLDPDADLAPGFCDPLQVTDKAYNDSAIWVDFTKDDKPRHFRLGVFGALKAWNAGDTRPDKNPAFNTRLVVVNKPPFTRARWTNVAIAFSHLGSGAGEASLYVDGKLQGASPKISEIFEWDLDKAAIRLGVNYVGLIDDVTVFSRPLTASEIANVAAGSAVR